MLAHEFETEESLDGLVPTVELKQATCHLLDGIGIGLGFTLALTVLGCVREILGSGAVFGWKFITGDGMLAFVMAPGAFICLGYLMVLFNMIAKKNK